MEKSRIQVKMSTTFHTSTNGASEIMNRMAKNYLRCYWSYHRDNWDQLLSSAKFSYNSAVSEDLEMSRLW